MKVKQKNQARIGILMADRSNPFWTDMKKYYDRLAEPRGLELDYFWPSPAMHAGAQSDVLMRMIESDFDAIIVNPLNNHNLAAGIQLASSNKIPVVDVGAKTDRQFFKDTPAYYFPIQTVDFTLQGKLAGQYILERLAPGEKAQVVILEGRAGSAQSIARAGGAAKVFECNPGVGLLIREPADFDRSQAQGAVKGIIRNNGHIDAFFCTNDLMALGVADAISDLKNVPRPIIVGVDLIAEARDAIKMGLISASVAFSRKKVAALVLETAIACIDGRKGPCPGPVSSHLVSLENIEEFND